MAKQRGRSNRAKSKSDRASRAKAKTRQQPKRVKQTDRVHNPHDSFFHRTFSQLDHAREFLATFLPKEIVDRLNLEEIALKQDKYTDEQLKNHITDLLFEVPLEKVASSPATMPLSIYCLYEHKSSPEPDLLFQVLRYMQERLLADLVDKKKLRPIVVLVFYHGKEAWNIPTEFLDQFEDVEPIFHEFIPKFKYLLIDMKQYEADAILTQIESGSLQASLLLLKYIYDEALNAKVAEILRPLAAANLSSERLVAHLEAILSYMTGIQRPVPDQLLNQEVNRIFSEGESMIKSITERWKEEGINIGINIGIEQGIERGVEQGVEQGLAKGRQETIGLILNHRFQLNEQEMEQVAIRLAPIQSAETLDALVNLALGATVSDLPSFLAQLPSVEGLEEREE